MGAFKNTPYVLPQTFLGAALAWLWLHPLLPVPGFGRVLPLQAGPEPCALTLPPEEATLGTLHAPQHEFLEVSTASTSCKINSYFSWRAD